MSIAALPTGEPTCTVDDLRAICRAKDIFLDPDSPSESAFLLLANSFDAACRQIQDLPAYEDPRLKPTPTLGGERTFSRPSAQDNPLNAWSHRTHLRSTTQGPLAGKTVAIKDNVSVAGLPHVLGCAPELYADNRHPVSTIDATIVRRILAAGGTIVGTATCENLSLAPLSFTAASGNVRNAWRPGYATGGSSSGCASLLSVADVAAARREGRDDGSRHVLGEGVDLAVGGDQGGSIRLPAGYAGVYGLKPTHGLVPYTGIASLFPLLDHTGPMARSVDDLALLLGVLAGDDGIDPRATPATPTRDAVPDYLADLHAWEEEKRRAGEWTASTAARGLRVGVLREGLAMTGLDARVRAAVEAAAERFRTLGATEIREVSVPLHAAGAALWSVAPRTGFPKAFANMPPDQLAHPLPHLAPRPRDASVAEVLNRRNPAVVNTLITAARLEDVSNPHGGPALVRKAYMHIFELRAAYDRAFEEVDVLLVPTTPGPAVKFPASSVSTEANPNGWNERVMDLFEPGIGVTQNTCPFNLSGHPAMSLPIGWVEVEDGRLPIGMQIVGRRWDEATVFKAAKAWEVGGRGLDS